MVPDGLTLHSLPGRSPELQPAERLWGLIDEAVANRMWATLDDVQATVVEWCRVMRATMRAYVHRLTRYHCWLSFA